MRKRLFPALVVGVSTLLFALPAFATINFELVAATADCDGYAIHVRGTTTAATATYSACYTFSIGDEPVVNDCEPITITPGSPADLTVSGAWTELPCGAFTVTGAVELIPPEGSGYPRFDLPFGPIELVCPCECNASLSATIIADCEGYTITVTGATEVTYLASYSVYLEGELVAQAAGEEIAASPAVERDFTGSWVDGPLCGAFAVTGGFSLTPPDGSSCPSFDASFDPITLDCPCGDSPGTGTPGYWKNHPEAWPMEAEEIEIGCAVYDKYIAIDLMGAPEKGDKRYTIFRALVAAKLNIMIGNESDCLYDDDISVIEEADAWLCENTQPVGGRDPAWRYGEALYCILDAYNNGFLCAPSRDAMEVVD